MERITGRWPCGLANYPRGHLPDVINRLTAIEDILGDDYDLDRLRELVEADREGRCVVLPMPVPCYCFVAIKGGAPAYRCYYLSPASMLCDMERGYSFGSTKEEAEAALKGE